MIPSPLRRRFGIKSSSSSSGSSERRSESRDRKSKRRSSSRTKKGLEWLNEQNYMSSSIRKETVNKPLRAAALQHFSAPWMKSVIS